MHHALCHCSDCRRHAGAPMVGWAMFKSGQVAIEGEPVIYASSEHGRRHFCGACGTGLFYTNEAILPGITDIQSGTLDAPGALPAQVHIQVADRIAWMKDISGLPEFERFPGN
jgi:hypothetical protein